MLTAEENQFLERIAFASGLDDVDRACEKLHVATRGTLGGTAERHVALAGALHFQLCRASPHPAYRRWVDVFFGRRSEHFRSSLQQPGYLYYPALAPRAWFGSEECPGLHAARDHLQAVRAELMDLARSQPDFRPYVESEAARDPRWRSLAGSDAWLAIHLVRGGVWNPALPNGLVATRALLEQVPLAQCPPHAPECFVSRLRPGVVLPPHFGLSNIKLTVHLAIELPPSGCSITVGRETRSWSMDDFLVFDDSFIHTAANHSDRDRTVLIFDIWHPGLSEEERRALAYAIVLIDRVRSAWEGRPVSAQGSVVP
jgi:hypothetical protein